MTLTFGYWGIKGQAEHLRLLLRYLEMEHEEVNPSSKEDWMATVPKLMEQGMEYPNLPYVIDGDFMTSESEAIGFYLAHKAGKPELVGKNLQDQTHVRQLEGIVIDIKNSILMAMFNPDHVTAIAGAIKPDGKAMRKLGLLAKNLGEKKFLMGYFTLADLKLTYLIHLVGKVLEQVDTENVLLNTHANIQALHDEVLSLPGIKEYVASPAWQKPVFPPGMIPWMK